MAQLIPGQVFDRLTVISRHGTNKNGHALWLCVCVCGETTVAFANNLRRGHTKSCGCLNTEAVTKHGHWDSLTYQSWKGIIQRCTNPNSKAWDRYGGRGITVCPEWLVFENFLKDMGARPGKNMTIERIENDKGYYKSNCKWATKKEQANNRRKRSAKPVDAGRG